MLLLVSTAQSYHAYNGSSYAGIFSMYNNPASTVNTAYKWDVNALSFQTTLINNTFDLSGLVGSDTLKYALKNGVQSRSINNTFDINVANFRYQINENTAIAFGLRGRMYNHVRTTDMNYLDSISGINSFLHINKNTQELSGFATHNGWIEFDVNIAKVLKKDDHQIIAGGITIGYIKSISGASTQANKLTFLETNFPNGDYLQTLTGLNLASYYSHNYDLLDSTKTGFENTKTFIKNSKSGLSISGGFEILLKKTSPYNNEEINQLNYDWKIGISIMDLGKNTFAANDRAFANGLPNILLTSADLQGKFGNIKNLKQLTDSILGSFSSYDTISKFSISMPTRLIVSIDKNFGNNFFVNATGSFNFFSSTPYNKIHTRELNLITVTPRWEKKNIGIYFPLQFNAENNVWFGVGLKLGPLLLGVHNIDWATKKLDQLKGGFYFGIHIKARDKAVKSKYDCITY